MAKQQKAIGYVRVSTAKQGASGLGLEAQEAAVRGYCEREGLRLLKVHVEIESGKRDDRPELTEALADCRRTGAVLVVAKLDRLSRNVAFLADLMDSGADFVALDNPHATPLTVHILAAVAQAEREATSARTKAALAAAKARGVKLGGQDPRCRNLTAAAQRRGVARAAEARTARRLERARLVLPIVTELREVGLSLREVAAELTARGIETARGCEWNAVQVSRVLAVA